MLFDNNKTFDGIRICDGRGDILFVPCFLYTHINGIEGGEATCEILSIYMTTKKCFM